MRSLVSIIGLLVVAGCYYDNEETLYPGSENCQVPDAATYALHIKPIIDAKCNSCHAGNFASGNIRLDSYTEVMKYVNNGSFMGSINQVSNYSPMPKNSSKLPACQIQTLQQWIDAGATNN